MTIIDQMVAAALSPVQVHLGEAQNVLPNMAAQSVNCVVTSPPYWGLRDYGLGPNALGLEPTPELYAQHLVEIFRQVKRVLRDDGTLWLNLGDSYAAQGGPQVTGTKQVEGSQDGAWGGTSRKPPQGLKAKDLVGIPWRVAFALQADGWYLRSDIIWHKPNPMPDSTKDRPTKAHEYLFLLAKSKKYHYDHESIKEPAVTAGTSIKMPDGMATYSGSHGTIHKDGREKGRANNAIQAETRNKRSVWTVTTKPYKKAHFATFPPDLIEPCILAGCPPDGSVLDPFAGSGTVGMVAMQHNRKAILIEPNPEYIELINERIGL